MKVKTTLDKQNKKLDKAISDITKDAESYINPMSIFSLEGLLMDSENIVKVRLNARLEQITKLLEFKHNLPSELVEFMVLCKEWLRELISIPKLNQKSFGNDFQITSLGDIISNSNSKDRGICLTYKTQIIAGEFREGLLQTCEATILS
jgi:hypothetical protein